MHTIKSFLEVGEELGDYALQRLKDNGVEFIMNTNVKGATANTAKLDNGTVIPTYTLIWTAGVTPTKVVVNLPCEHDKGHRIVANNYLEVPGYDGVYAVGDCEPYQIHIQEKFILRQHKMHRGR